MKQRMFITIAVLTVLVGCVAGAKGENVRFCPQPEEEGTRRVLALGSRSSISESEFLALVVQNGLRFEESTGPYHIPRKCDFSGQLDIIRGYNIYAGWDEKKTHTRNYLVLVGSDNKIAYIISQHDYKNPTFNWNF